MYWTIYKHTSPDGKVYVGQTRQQIPENRWQRGEGYKSNTEFYEDICKYGWDNFKHEILESGITSQEEADKREIYWIKRFDSYNKGYNRTPGGHTAGYSLKKDGGNNTMANDANTQLSIVKENRQMIEDAYDKVLLAKDGVMSLKEEGSKVRIETFSDEKGREQNRMYGEYLEGSIKENFEERVALVEEKILLKQEVADMRIALADERAAAEREIQAKKTAADLEIQKKKNEADIEIQRTKMEAEFELEKLEKKIVAIKKDKVKHTVWKFLWPTLGAIAGVLSYALMFLLV